MLLRGETYADHDSHGRAGLVTVSSLSPPLKPNIVASIVRAGLIVQ